MFDDEKVCGFCKHYQKNDACWDADSLCGHFEPMHHQNCENKFKNVANKFDDLEHFFQKMHKPDTFNFPLSRKQKKHEIPYLYVGLMREVGLHKQDKEIVELGQDAINYRRVEMCPCDWEYFYHTYSSSAECIKLWNEDTNKFSIMTNGVNIKFPVIGSKWGVVSHFGIYDSIQVKSVGDKNAGYLICIGKLDMPFHITDNIKGLAVEFSAGQLEIELSALHLQR